MPKVIATGTSSHGAHSSSSSSASSVSVSKLAPRSSGGKSGGPSTAGDSAASRSSAAVALGAAKTACCAARGSGAFGLVAAFAKNVFSDGCVRGSGGGGSLRLLIESCQFYLANCRAWRSVARKFTIQKTPVFQNRDLRFFKLTSA